MHSEAAAMLAGPRRNSRGPGSLRNTSVDLIRRSTQPLTLHRWSSQWSTACSRSPHYWSVANGTLLPASLKKLMYTSPGPFDVLSTIV